MFVDEPATAKTACLLFFVLASLLPAQTAAPSPPAPQTPPARRAARPEMRQFLGLGAAPDAAAAARGAQLYASNCAFCHGANANGAEGPDLVRSTLVLHDEKGELIGPLVHGGRPASGMPSFSTLTEAQLYDLAEFLHMRVELAANRGLYQLQNVVTGNPQSGEIYFRAHCASCHSVTGDLAHIASKMQPADLQQSFLYPGARGYDTAQPAAARVTVTLPSGQTVSGTLKRLDDFSVSLFDSAGEYHSYPLGAGVRVEVEDKLLAHRLLLAQYSDADMHNITAFLAALK